MISQRARYYNSVRQEIVRQFNYSETNQAFISDGRLPLPNYFNFPDQGYYVLRVRTKKKAKAETVIYQKKIYDYIRKGKKIAARRKRKLKNE